MESSTSPAEHEPVEPPVQAQAPEVPVEASDPVAPAPGALALDDVEQVVPVASDLGAVEETRPYEPAPATNLDLPSLELPFPAQAPVPVPPPVAPAASYGMPPAGGDYSENLARQAYGAPTAEPTPPVAAPYADNPYAAGPGATPQPPFGQTPYGQPQYGQPQYGQPQYGQVVPVTEFSATDEKTWSTAAHWSSILLSLISLPFLGPLLIMLVQGPKSRRVRANAVESLNFDITMTIAMVVSFLLTLVVIGALLVPVVFVVWVVMKIIASVQTNNGADYRYPFNIRLVK